MKSSLLVILLLFSSFSNAQNSCRALFNENTPTKSLVEILKKNLYEVGRKLITYSILFPMKIKENSFSNTVKNLKENSVWVDMGAGEAKALIEGLSTNSNIKKAVAISFEKPGGFTHPAEFSDRFEYLSGDYIENLYTNGKLDHLKGKVNLLSDVFGPLSYSKDIHNLLNIYFKLLKKDGVLFFDLITERNFTVDQNQRKNLETDPVIQNSFSNSNGEAGVHLFVDWLKSIKGIEVDEVTSYTVRLSSTDEAFTEKSVGFRIRKISEDVDLRTSFSTDFFQPSSPPIRSFILN